MHSAINHAPNFHNRLLVYQIVINTPQDGGMIMNDAPSPAINLIDYICDSYWHKNVMQLIAREILLFLYNLN